jgi:hypothetical protein
MQTDVFTGNDGVGNTASVGRALVGGNSAFNGLGGYFRLMGGFVRLGPSTAIATTPAQVNIADIPGSFMNFMKGFQSISFNGGADPSDLDANGYPNAAMAGLSASGNIGGSIALPAGFASGNVTWVLKWPATTVLKFVIQNGPTKTLVVNATVTGGSNSAMTITTNGSAGRVEFFFNSYNSSSVSFFFPGGFADSAPAGGLVLVRKSDEAAYDADIAAGITPFTPEFLALFTGPTGLNPKTIRTMGMTQGLTGNFTNQVQWRYRTTPSSLSWYNPQFPPGAWGSTVSGTDTYTMGAASDTPASWTGGEVIQGMVTNANTSATPTLNVNGRGAKTIANSQGTALSAGSIPANSVATFVYDDLLDKVLYSSGGITQSIPIEAQVSLANQLNANLWAVIPPWADDTYVSTWASYVRDNLNPALTFYAEYGNEIWNFAFPQTQWAFQRGLALGFPNGNNEPHYGWYGLRFRQIMGAITPLWTANGRSLATLKRVMAFQAFGNPSQTNTYRLQGADLSTSLGYTRYNSYVGQNYNSAPNRPIDYADVLSYATYYQGANFNGGSSYTSASAAFLQTLADQYNSGDPAQIATAEASLDADIRSGTINGVLGSQTLLGFSTNIYPAWEAVAAGYTGKTVEAYEGGLQALAPTTAQASSTGISIGGSAANASAALAALLVAYKNNPAYGIPIVTDQFNQFLSQSHSRQPSWLQTIGPSQWSLLPGDLFTISTPYQTWYGFKSFH